MGKVFRIAKSFTFDSAHFLPYVEDGHKCKNMHGHTYTVEVIFRGELDQTHKWLVDYGEISRVVRPLVKKLDHQILNDIEGLDSTTAEELTIWFYDRIKPVLPQLHIVRVRETPNTWAEYAGELND